MLKTKEKLTILHYDGSTYTDRSNESLDFDRDQYSLQLGASDYLYVGYYKPINIFYAAMGLPNDNTGTMTGEFYNGTAWVSLSGYFDETKSLTRSGFIQWDRNQTSEAKTTINSIELFWYRFQPSAAHSKSIVKGINILFSDDNDLKREFFEIGEFLPKDENSHILTHIATRDHIIQYIRNSGYFKENQNNGRVKDITAFDLLDVGQIRLAANYLSLSKIFGSVTDDPDDIYLTKSKEFMSLFSSAISTFYLDLDYDDDGIQDEEERLASFTARLVRR